MTNDADGASFEKIVDWAYNTLPEGVRNLPDFPGIQIADEPTREMYEKVSKRGNWPRGSELLGCYSGVSRTKRQHNLLRTTPDLIFVFRGPILRCSRGNLPDEVKQVVWHEVAHWLGHDEQEIKELGLSRKFEEIAREQIESDAWGAVLQRRLPNTVEDEEQTNQPNRCLKCYSADVACREVDEAMIPPGAWLADPVTVHIMRIWKCGSCGFEWDDGGAGEA